LISLAHGIAWATRWDLSEQWFEIAVSGLEQYGWPGAPLLRKLIPLGFFDDKEFSDAENDTFIGFYDALNNDDFQVAAQVLEEYSQLRGLTPPRIDCPGQTFLRFPEESGNNDGLSLLAN
jgi:hypothetical protein